MIILMIIVSLLIAITVSVLSSCYVCYNVAIDPETPMSTMTTVAGIVLLNAMIPFALGCYVGLWYVA